MTKKRIVIITITFIIICLIFIIKLIGYECLPYKYASWGKYIMGSKLKYEFCTYDIPETYDFVDFRDSGEFENALVLWKDRTTDQHTLFLRIRQQLKLDPKYVTFANRKITRSFHMENRRISDNLELHTFIPFLVDNYPMKTPPELEVRGVELTKKDGAAFSTDTTDVFYTEGVSKAIGFYKPKKGLYKYITHAFVFPKRMHIGFAVIRYKKTNDVILSISYVPEGKKFDRETFLKLVNSVKFETQPFSDPYHVFTHRHKYVYQ